VPSETPTQAPTKIIPAIPLPQPERDPNIPTDRDAIVDDKRHRGTMILEDLIRIHYYLWKKENHHPKNTPSKDGDVEMAPSSSEANTDAPAKEGEADATKATEEPKPQFTPGNALLGSIVSAPTDTREVWSLATRLVDLFVHGRRYELSGLKDVPTPFFKLGGRFFEKLQSSETETETDERKKWRCLEKEEAISYVARHIIELFAELACFDNEEVERTVNPGFSVGATEVPEGETTAINKTVDLFFSNLKELSAGDDASSDPRPYDVIFLPVQTPWEENMNYEHSSGNKNLLYLASQHVSVETRLSISRVKAAFALITAKVQVTSGTELVTKDQRFVILRNTGDKGQNAWEDMERNDLAEFAAIFVFEVYLEKRIYEETSIGSNVGAGTPVTPGSTQAAMKDLLSPSDANKPSDVPIPHPTTHDVLFGRG